VRKAPRAEASAALARHAPAGQDRPSPGPKRFELGRVDDVAGTIEALKSQVAAIDERLNRITTALQK
jgi:hypothetical protein